MYSVMIASAGIPRTFLCADNPEENAHPDCNDPWLFTDQFAKVLYSQQGRLSQLKRDIRKYVMSNNQWSWDELAFKQELRRLVRAGVLQPQLAFGHLSPHPTIYLTVEEAILEIGGEKFYLNIGDQVVFEPWLARIYYPGIVGPLRIGRFDITRNYRLSFEAFPQLHCLSERDFGALRQIMYSARQRRN
jgi:hypothetical protein